MYGLPSRESLSRRQARWIREIDINVRGNPVQNALNREHPTNSTRDNLGLITMMIDPQEENPGVGDSGSSLAMGHNPILRKNTHNNPYGNKPSQFNGHLMGLIPDDPADQLVTIQTLYEEIKQKYTKLEQQYEELIVKVRKLGTESNHNSNINAKLNKFEQTLSTNSELHNRVQKLENNSDINLLIDRVAMLEKSLNDVSGRDIIKQPEDDRQQLPHNRVVSVRGGDSSEFSALTELDMSIRDDSISGIYEFTPYFIKEDYSSRDNITRLEGTNFQMLVEILGFYSENPVIFPFGIETNLPRFAELTLEMSFKDADNIVDGTAYGIFGRRSDGIYIIRLTELYSGGNASGIEKYTLPLTFTCKTNLILE